ADGDIDLAAHTLNNIRTSIVTAPGTPQTATKTLSTWYRDGVIDWTGNNTLPVTVTVDKSTVTNLDTTAKSLTLIKPATERYPDPAAIRQCGREDIECRQNVPQLTRDITANAAQWYQSIQDNGGTYTITFRPDWDPSRNIQPDQVRVRFDLGPDSHDYHELSRTTTTTTATDQLISATDPAKIRASGAIRVNADGGAILNQSSIMAAGGNLVRSAAGGTVTDQGTVLQQSVSTTETSTFFWHAKTWDGSDTQVVPYPATPQPSTTVVALPAIASSNQAVQTTAQTINVTTVNRLGQTVTGSGLSGGGASGAVVGSAGNGAGAPGASAGTLSGSA
ncbi:hemagglutinin repeat-containing protein, partial [Ralstonia syzygii]